MRVKSLLFKGKREREVVQVGLKVWAGKEVHLAKCAQTDLDSGHTPTKIWKKLDSNSKKYYLLLKSEVPWYYFKPSFEKAPNKFWWEVSPLKVHRPRVWFISWYSTVIIVFMSGNPMITFFLSLKKKKSRRKNKWYVCCQCKIRLRMVFLFLFPGREKNNAQCTVMLECVTTNKQKTGFTKLLLLWAQCGFQKQYCHDHAYSH